MSPSRKIALFAGVFLIITFVSSIAGLFLYDPVLKHSDYILGSGADFRISLGAFCELVLVVANMGCAIVLYPILKRQSESIALGYVAARIFESTVIAVGIVSVLSVLTLQKHYEGAPGTDSGVLLAASRSLVAVHDWTFLLGPAFVASFGNGMLLGFLMYRSGLVPRRLAMIGLVGGPLAVITATAVLFGVYDQTSTLSSLLTVPEAVWEFSLGIYLIVKGFKAVPIASAFDSELPKSGIGEVLLSPA